MLKTIIGKLEKKNNDMDAEVAQLKHNNNKCYTSTFRHTSHKPAHCEW